MPNEVIFLILAAVDLFFIFLVARRAPEWLFGTIITNFFLISLFGAKLVTLFGMTTNAGNVFYACIFFATYFIFVYRGKKVAKKSVVFGAVFMLLFGTLTLLTTLLPGNAASSVVNNALSMLFSFSPRVMIASVVAYIFAQYINIFVFDWVVSRTKGAQYLLAANVANAVGQAIDSTIFFSIVFFDLPGPLLVQAIAVGWLCKVAVVALGTPLLAADAHLSRGKV